MIDYLMNVRIPNAQVITTNSIDFVQYLIYEFIRITGEDSYQLHWR